MMCAVTLCSSKTSSMSLGQLPRSTRATRGVTNSHRVVIALTDAGAQTRVSVTQDSNLTSQAHAHAEGGWRLAPNNLKAIVEGTRVIEPCDDVPV